MTAPAIREVSYKMNTSLDPERQLKCRSHKRIDSRRESLVLLNSGHQGLEVFRNFSPTAMGFGVHLLEPTHVFESLSCSLGVAYEQEVILAASHRFRRNI